MNFFLFFFIFFIFFLTKTSLPESCLSNGGRNSAGGRVGGVKGSGSTTMLFNRQGKKSLYFDRQRLVWQEKWALREEAREEVKPGEAGGLTDRHFNFSVYFVPRSL